MPEARFLQIHSLASYPGTLLNRDDAGFAKRLPFAGSIRTRISSQCLKRHWRRAEGEHALSEVPGDGDHLPMAVRSRRTFEEKVYRPLVAGGATEEAAQAVTAALMDVVLQKSEARAAKEDEDPGASLRTNQVVVIGQPEVDFLLRLAREALESAEPAGDAKAAVDALREGLDRDGKKNLRELSHDSGLGAGLDAALFGRMVTSDVLARCDAAVHVAHAFTVHAEESESDYFTAVDDLRQESGETGSGHINSAELTSGLYYGYVAVDVPLLVSNLASDRPLAAEVVRRLIHLVATVSPGAKLGSTAPHACVQAMLVEAGDGAPRSLANAFMQAVEARGDLLGATYGVLARHLRELDEVFEAPSHGRRGLALGPREALDGRFGELGSLRELARWAAGQVAG